MELKDLILQALDEVENGAQESANKENQKDSSTLDSSIASNEISLNARLSENLNALKDNLNSELDSAESNAKIPRPNSNLSNQSNIANALSATNDGAKLGRDSKKSLLKIESSKTTSGKVIPPQEAVFSPTNIEFLEMLREKLLVLFEGLKMPQMKDSQEKLDLVVNFLQYELCLLDDFLKDNKK